MSFKIRIFLYVCLKLGMDGVVLRSVGSEFQREDPKFFILSFLKDARRR